MSQIFLSRPLNIFPSAPACPSPTTALLARTRPAPRPASPSSTTSTRTGSSGTTWPATTRSPPSASPGTRQQTLLLFIHIYTIYIQPVTVQKSQNISLLYYTTDLHITTENTRSSLYSQEDWTSTQVCPEEIYNIGNMGRLFIFRYPQILCNFKLQ